jgi:hypothetical protein
MLKIIASAVTIAFAATAAQAALPVYSNPGTQVPVAYTFTKLSDGDLVATFVGETAGFTNRLGVIANGVDLGLGLSNESPLGTSFNYGSVAAGSSLVFYIKVQNNGNVFSSVSADNPGGLNHVFAAAYGGGDTVGIRNFEPSTYVYVGFEDLKGGGDLDYDDIQFVFANVRAVIPEPATWALLITGFGMVGLAVRRRRIFTAVGN